MSEIAGLSGLPPLPLGADAATPEASARQAPAFAEPEPLKFDDEERQKLLTTFQDLYQASVQSRELWAKRHQDYDLMFRGRLDIRGPNSGPWTDSANLHVQMPYWAVSAYNARLVSGVWNQNPLVVGRPVEDDDIEVARNSSKLVEWHFQPKRMNAQAMWDRVSKTRCIHGRGVGVVPWAKDQFVYREASEDRIVLDDDGNIVYDDDGRPRTTPGKPLLRRQTRMDGPLLIPVEWDDVLEPIEGLNLQPVSPSNPLGADWVGIRSWETLSLIWKKRQSSYTYIDDDDDLKDRQKGWIDQAPSQDRSGSGSGSTGNQKRARLQDQVEGRRRDPLTGDRSPRSRSNPEFETVTWMMPWELKNERGEFEESECVFFWRVQPSALLGAWRLSDLQYRNRRPLIELDFQTAGNRRQSMGIPEIVSDLSAELDTIHNMRLDVGFATNIPFFFYVATSNINPSRITLRPGRGIPVDDVRDIQFPQLQSVTSFYYQEEQLLYSLVERVLGVTDLFLGVSPSRGAAARHATGFVGTQQESLSRTQPLLDADAVQFSLLCHLVYEAEIQFGPDERIFRLQGREGALTQRLTRDELWFRGEYDFSLGANYGMYSSMLRQQQAQILMQTAPNSPLVNADPGRRWEVENFVYLAFGFPDPELFIGPKSAISAGSPTDPDEENGEMDQFVHGVGVPAPVHPSDNDAEHLRSHLEHLQDPAFIGLGKPNLAGHLAHLQATQAQMMRKQQLQQAATEQALSGGSPAAPTGGAQPNARNVASLEGVESIGGMGDVNARPGGPATMPFGGNGAPGTSEV